MDKKILIVGVLSFVGISITALGVFQFVTVDPEWVTPQRVQECVNHFRSTNIVRDLKYLLK